MENLLNQTPGVAQQILQELPLDQIIATCQVNKHLYTKVCTDTFWKRFLQTEFYFQRLPSDLKTWRQAAIELNKLHQLLFNSVDLLTVFNKIKPLLNKDPYDPDREILSVMAIYIEGNFTTPGYDKIKAARKNRYVDIGVGFELLPTGQWLYGIAKSEQQIPSNEIKDFIYREMKYAQAITKIRVKVNHREVVGTKYDNTYTNLLYDPLVEYTFNPIDDVDLEDYTDKEAYDDDEVNEEEPEDDVEDEDEDSE